jgi:hypothetical protein
MASKNFREAYNSSSRNNHRKYLISIFNNYKSIQTSTTNFANSFIVAGLFYPSVVLLNLELDVENTLLAF